MPIEESNFLLIGGSKAFSIFNRMTCRVECCGKTGVEMEALTGVSIALLTVYDMCKAVTKDMVIKDIRLLSKSGGKSDYKLD